MLTTLRRFSAILSLILAAMVAAVACHGVPEDTGGRIVTAVDDEPTRHAAEELRHWLREATGVPGPASGEILVGWGDEAKAAAPDLGPDAFVWKGDGDRLVIGGPGKGTLYGVYAFLEEHLGIRRFTPEVSLVPTRETFRLPVVDEIRRPAFPVRWVHMPAANDQRWCDWHGVHSRPHREAFWGMFVHTFEKLVPPEEHFEEHPEYFSELAGKRVPNMQLCLTNEAVFRIVVDELRKRMAARPDAKAWSVSQNDRHGACECDDCRALVAKHGGEAGPLLAFVNRVAAEFPEKTISTLAYTYTRRAPKGIRPAPNVNICLCSIECDRAEPIGKGDRDADFRRDIEEWSALTDNLMIWDYVVQFSNYVSPFPNFHVLQPNIRLFRDAKVQWMFQQGSGDSRSDLSELKQYVIAKLLWDPDRDVDEIIDEFLAGCYGPAAPTMRRYFDLLHARLLESGATLSIYGSPVVEGETWLDLETLLTAGKTLDLACSAADGRPEILTRIRDVRLSLMYAGLEQAKRHGAGEQGLFEPDGKGGWQAKDLWRKMLDAFVAGCEAGGFERVHERESPPAEYGELTRRFFDEGMVSHLAAGRTVGLTVPFRDKWPANGITTLTDGLKGTTDYRYNWLGWEATDTTMTVDLGEVREVTGVGADFLQVIGSWIWLPLEVRWSTSVDGKTWEPAGTLTPKAPTTRDDFFTERFGAEFPPRKARYARMDVDGIQHCPDWHQGAGGDAWFFCDEIMVIGR
ncbi:MAG: DUF4838 domain-containing protein [Planctomycetota bacterium]